MSEPLYRLFPSMDTTAGTIHDRAVWRTCPDCKERVNAYAFERCTRCGHDACTACNLRRDTLALDDDEDADYVEEIVCRRCRGD